MTRWHNPQFAVATLEALATGDDTRGHVCLAAMAKDPATIAAIAKAREAVPRQRWTQLASEGWGGSSISEDERAVAKAVWRTMPGYTCIHDALQLLGRA